MIWTIYILLCSDQTLYTGITKNIEKRLTAHNKGVGAKYTRGRLPVKLIRSFFRPTKSEALKLEIKLKKLPRPKKLAYKE